MTRYRVSYSDMWCLASFDCFADSYKEALAKANAFFGEKVASWYNGGCPTVFTMEEQNACMVRAFGHESEIPWAENRSLYSTQG